MKEMINLIKNLTEEDYKNNKVNLHMHTVFSDGKGDAKQILNSAKNKNYKLISITDHNTVEAHNILQDEILVPGIEFDCWSGYVFIHLLAYGIDINDEYLSEFYAKDKSGTESALTRLFTRRNIKDLIAAIHHAGGIAVLAHPACCWAFSLENLVKKLMKIGLDGIEVYYPYPGLRSMVKFHNPQVVYKIAEKYSQLIRTGGTDFHGEIF